MKLLIFLLSLVPFSLSAQTIASYVGTAPTGVVNTPLTCNGVVVTKLYNGGATFPGAAYVTYQQGNAPIATTTCTTTFTSVAGATGSIQVMCDDSCTVSLNGTQIGVTTPGQYNSVQTFPITAAAGTNTLSIAVKNTAGFTGLGFLATLTAPAPLVAPVTSTTYSITGPATLVLRSDGSFTLSGSGIKVQKQ